MESFNILQNLGQVRLKMRNNYVQCLFNYLKSLLIQYAYIYAVFVEKVTIVIDKTFCCNF